MGEGGALIYFLQSTGTGWTFQKSAVAKPPLFPCSHRRTIQSVPYYPNPASCVSRSPCVLPLKRTRLDLEPARSGSCILCSHRRTIHPVPYYPIPASCVSHNPCTAPLQRRPRRMWIRTRPALPLEPEPTKSGSCSPCSYRRTTQPLPYYPIPASPVSYSPREKTKRIVYVSNDYIYKEYIFVHE